MEEWIPVRNTPCMAPLTNCFDSVAQHGEVLIRTNVPKWAPFSPCFDYQPKRGIFLNQFEQRFDTGWAVIGSNHKADFVSSCKPSSFNYGETPSTRRGCTRGHRPLRGAVISFETCPGPLTRRAPVFACLLCVVEARVGLASTYSWLLLSYLD